MSLGSMSLCKVSTARPGTLVAPLLGLQTVPNYEGTLLKPPLRSSDGKPWKIPCRRALSPTGRASRHACLGLPEPPPVGPASADGEVGTAPAEKTTLRGLPLTQLPPREDDLTFSLDHPEDVPSLHATARGVVATPVDATLKTDALDFLAPCSGAAFHYHTFFLGVEQAAFTLECASPSAFTRSHCPPGHLRRCAIIRSLRFVGDVRQDDSKGLAREGWFTYTPQLASAACAAVFYGRLPILPQARCPFTSRSFPALSCALARTGDSEPDSRRLRGCVVIMGCGCRAQGVTSPLEIASCTASIQCITHEIGQLALKTECMTHSAKPKAPCCRVRVLCDCTLLGRPRPHLRCTVPDESVAPSCVERLSLPLQPCISSVQSAPTPLHVALDASLPRAK